MLLSRLRRLFVVDKPEEPPLTIFLKHKGFWIAYDRRKPKSERPQRTSS